MLQDTPAEVQVLKGLRTSPLRSVLQFLPPDSKVDSCRCFCVHLKTLIWTYLGTFAICFVINANWYQSYEIVRHQRSMKMHFKYWHHMLYRSEPKRTFDSITIGPIIIGFDLNLDLVYPPFLVYVILLTTGAKYVWSTKTSHFHIKVVSIPVFFRNLMVLDNR